ncbi:hypothetical protein ARMSODRAFT_371703 [Armillaria solidipes]|uniref:Uncharacterized protein n=1 Tax=Armillaria solidipes TaxID=1076256 RepID=A0A2H3BNN2_9AGAR|nr:hypothetical protein ARMSODRAFT_371703 [Armillaria solidipes]
MEKRYRFRQIKSIELLNLPTALDTRYYRLKIFAGSVYKKTDTYTLKTKALKTTLIPKWTIRLDL